MQEHCPTFKIKIYSEYRDFYNFPPSLPVTDCMK